MKVVSLEKTIENKMKVKKWIEEEGAFDALLQFVEPRNKMKKYVRNNVIILHEKIVGMIGYYHNDSLEVITIWSTFINEDERNKGYGQILFNEVLKYANKMKRDIALNPNDEYARDFWVHIGFVPMMKMGKEDYGRLFYSIDSTPKKYKYDRFFWNVMEMDNEKKIKKIKKLVKKLTRNKVYEFLVNDDEDNINSYSVLAIYYKKDLGENYLIDLYCDKMTEEQNELVRSIDVEYIDEDAESDYKLRVLFTFNVD